MEEQELNMIETKEYQIIPKEIFKINLKKRFKYFKWILLIAFIFGVLYIIDGDIQFTIFLYLLCSIITLIITYQTYKYAYRNKIFYSTYKILFNEQKLISISSDKSKSEIPKELIVKAEADKEYFFLFLTSKNFFIVPKNIFNKDADYNLFESTFIKKTFSN
jgi:hypothetical protein